MSRNTAARWSENQCKAVAAYVATVRRGLPDTVLADALVAGQTAIIPPEQHLAFGSLRDYTNHAKALRSALEAAGVAYPVRKSPVQAQKPPKTETFPPPATVVAPPAPLALADATLEQLLARVVSLQRQQIAAAVEVAVAARLAAAFDVPGERAEPVSWQFAAPAARSAQRVLVVGLLPVQSAIVAQRLGGTVDLRFSTDESTTQLRAAAGWADLVVTMTKFISHSTEDVIKRTGKPLLRCNGGVTDLVTQVNHCLETHK
jgi:hypothetical protein